jgi:hypothetical protein
MCAVVISCASSVCLWLHIQFLVVVVVVIVVVVVVVVVSVLAWRLLLFVIRKF